MSSKKQNKLQNYFPAKQPGSTATEPTMENSQDPDSQASQGSRSYLQAASQPASLANSQEGQPNSEQGATALQEGQPNSEPGATALQEGQPNSDQGATALQEKANPLRADASNHESSLQTAAKAPSKVLTTPLRSTKQSKRSATPDKPSLFLSPHQRHQQKACPTSIVESMSDSVPPSPNQSTVTHILDLLFR